MNDQADKSLSFLSAFHLIEHLDFETQFSFINAFRVLKPGGILLYETLMLEILMLVHLVFFMIPHMYDQYLGHWANLWLNMWVFYQSKLSI